MPDLYSSKMIIKVLEKLCFNFISQRGSYGKYRKKGDPTLTVIVPMGKRLIPYGTFRSILKQANVNEVKFKQLVN